MRAVDLGLLVSFSGVITFKKSDALRDIAREIPLDRLLVETDAPFLAPDPYRGKQNEPAYVAHTAAVLAEVKGVTPAALAGATTGNFFRYYTKAKRARDLPGTCKHELSLHHPRLRIIRRRAAHRHELGRVRS